MTLEPKNRGQSSRVRTYQDLVARVLDLASLNAHDRAIKLVADALDGEGSYLADERGRKKKRQRLKRLRQNLTWDHDRWKAMKAFRGSAEKALRRGNFRSAAQFSKRAAVQLTRLYYSSARALEVERRLRGKAERAQRAMLKKPVPPRTLPTRAHVIAAKRVKASPTQRRRSRRGADMTQQVEYLGDGLPPFYPNEN